MGDEESVWVGLRAGAGSSTCALVQAGIDYVSRLEEGEEELTFGPACKREGGSKWGGRLGCWPFGPGRGIERRAKHPIF